MRPTALASCARLAFELALASSGAPNARANSSALSDRARPRRYQPANSSSTASTPASAAAARKPRLALYTVRAAAPRSGTGLPPGGQLRSVHRGAARPLARLVELGEGRHSGGDGQAEGEFAQAEQHVPQNFFLARPAPVNEKMPGLKCAAVNFETEIAGKKSLLLRLPKYEKKKRRRKLKSIGSSHKRLYALLLRPGIE